MIPREAGREVVISLTPLPSFMAKIDTLKTAKRCIQAIEMACDGYQDRDVKKAKRRERQKGKQVIRQELKEHGESQKKKV